MTRSEIIMVMSGSFLKIAVIVFIITISFVLVVMPLNIDAAGPIKDTGQPKLPLSLRQAVEMALKNNRSLQTARRSLSIAASNYRSSKAEYFPKITGSLTSAHELLSVVDVDQTNLQQTFTGGLNLTLSMPLDLSGAIGRSVQQALIRLITQKGTYILSSQDLVVQVHQQYYDILKAREATMIDQAQVEQAKEQLRISKARLETGRLPESDVLTSKVQLDNALQNLKIDEGTYELAISNLRNTLVINQKVEILPTDKITFIPHNFDYEKSLKEAFEKRIEIKSAYLSLESAQIALKSTNDPYLPTLNIGGGYGYNIIGRNVRTAWQDRPREPTYSAGFNITVPLIIFDGGVIREAKVQALTNIDQAKANIKEAKERIELEVKNNLITLTNSQERVELGKSSIEIARETLRIAEMRYGYGLSGFLELTNAQTNLRTAELNYLNALIAYNISKINFYRVLGRPLTDPDQSLGNSEIIYPVDKQ